MDTVDTATKELATRLENAINQQDRIDFSLISGKGFIIWKRGTGDNVELTHLYVVPEHRNQGIGKELLISMLTSLRTNPPFCTVYGFTRTCNVMSQLFYSSMGFYLNPVHGVYADGDAVLFTQSFSHLCHLHGIGANDDN